MRPGAPGPALVLACALALSVPARATEPHEPPRGSAERRAILDTVRPAMEHLTRGPVEFVVSRLRSNGRHAFLAGTMQRPGGGAITCQGTAFADQCAFMDGLSVFALTVRGRGNVSGDWALLSWDVGPTDLSYGGWPRTFEVDCAVMFEPDTCAALAEGRR